MPHSNLLRSHTFLLRPLDIYYGHMCGEGLRYIVSYETERMNLVAYHHLLRCHLCLHRQEYIPPVTRFWKPLRAGLQTKVTLLPSAHPTRARYTSNAIEGALIRTVTT